MMIGVLDELLLLLLSTGAFVGTAVGVAVGVWSTTARLETVAVIPVEVCRLLENVVVEKEAGVLAVTRMAA